MDAENRRCLTCSVTLSMYVLECEHPSHFLAVRASMGERLNALPVMFDTACLESYSHMQSIGHAGRNDVNAP